ncbi:MAG: OmpA family protein [Bacteroidota bacterium]
MSKILNASIILALLLFVSTTYLNAQTKDMPNALGVKVLFLDYFTPNSGPSATLDDISNGFEVSYNRYLNNYLDFSVPLRFGVIDLPNDLDNASMVGLDALIKAKYYRDSNLVTPYLYGGVGYAFEGNNLGHFQAPVGVGFNFRTWKRAAINLQAGYRYSPTVDRNTLELGLGFIVNLGPLDADERDSDRDGVPDSVDKCPTMKGSKMAQGCPDKDGDGIADKRDKCPNEPGLVQFNGCPEDKAKKIDRDKDGIPDMEDECPTEAGLPENNGCPVKDADGDGVPDATDDCPTEAGILATRGCPDGDGDGVADKDDLCPTEAGVAALDGCPDNDGDGVANKDDNCPNTAGLAQFNGCPDTDNDGVADPNDKCPTTAGTAANFGCPEIKQEEREALALATRAIRFETGKATLKTASYDVLDQIVAILNRYPNYKVSIAGHTDSVGSADRNLSLSEERARSCYRYLLSKDFDPSRMSFVGYGETQPIASNSTRDGRRLNRRVEFNLYLE